jgi:hypothetical protein
VFASVLVQFLHDLGVLAGATCFEQRRRFADRQRSGTGSPLGVCSPRGAMSSHMVVAVLESLDEARTSVLTTKTAAISLRAPNV